MGTLGTKCPICRATFAQPAELNAHADVHRETDVYAELVRPGSQETNLPESPV
jgi:hypothetical protein